MARWALVTGRPYDNLQLGFTGNAYIVTQVMDADSAPSSDWLQCYEHTQPNWYYEEGIFISPAQMASYRGGAMWAAGGMKKIKPETPFFVPLWVVTVSTMGVFYYNKYNVDIKNTCVLNLKYNVILNDKADTWGIKKLASSNNITIGSVMSSQSLAERNHMWNRLVSAATGEDFTVYDNGTKIVISEPVSARVALEPDNYLLSRFPMGEDRIIIATLDSLVPRPQEGPEWYDIILDILT